MFKLMFFLYHREDLTLQAFDKYLREVHIPIVVKIPGLRRYVVNHALANPMGAAAPCDAVAELWFDDREAFEFALGSPEGEAAICDQPNYVDGGKTHFLVVDENKALG